MTGTSECNDYFDARHIDTSRANLLDRCPIRNCTSTLCTVPSQWGELPFCLSHGIRIHFSSRKFVYYNGPDPKAKKQAALRNIIIEKDYFSKYIYNSPKKAETYRFCFETSEDAFTWNVFSSLAHYKKLKYALSYLVGKDFLVDEPQLYLWGQRIDISKDKEPEVFSPLLFAREVFEPDISQYLTEPDLIMLIPRKILVVIEIKFTSGNSIAQNVTVDEDDVPESKDDILKRYKTLFLPRRVIKSIKTDDIFYDQLYRNLIFTIYMANKLGVDWRLINLVSKTQWSARSNNPKFTDPTCSIQEILSESYKNHFLFQTWEGLWVHCIKNDPELCLLSEYMQHKTARMAKAFELV
jgi:hypothetical protein